MAKAEREGACASPFPKVSIIVPVFKAQDTLERCVSSLLAQTLEDVEIILVDDGSPDNCGQVADEYARQDSRIRVIHQENAGMSFARNAGMDIAHGKYIGFVDSDDWIDPDMYKCLFLAAENAGVQVATGGIVFEDLGGTRTEQYASDSRVLRTPDEQRMLLVASYGAPKDGTRSFGFYPAVWDSIYERRHLENHGLRFEKNPYGEDVIFNIMLFRSGASLVVVPEAHYHYCENPTSITHSFDSDSLSRYLAFFERLITLVDEEPPEIVEECRLRAYANLLMSVGNFARLAADSGLGKEERAALLRKLCSHPAVRRASREIAHERLVPKERFNVWCIGHNLLPLYLSLRQIKHAIRRSCLR